jgi:tripartite ATP-independent transporter DctP family solute receptor
MRDPALTKLSSNRFNQTIGALVLSLTALAVGLTTTGCQETIRKKDFRSAEVHPGDYPTVAAVRFMGKRLSEESGGRLGVRVYPSGALGTERDNIELLKIGGLEMMRVHSGALNSVVPETIIPALPFVFRSKEHMRTVLDGPIGDEILDSMSAQGLVGLAFYDGGSRSFYTVKKPVEALADMRGLKVRVPQSDLFVAMMEALKSSPTPMPYGEVYTALKTGIVDAAENNWASYQSSRHFEAAPFFNETEHSMAPDVLVFSKKLWDKLPAADQAMIRKAARESVPHMRRLWEERETTARAKLAASGVRTVAIKNRREFIDAMKPVHARFATTPKLKSLLDRIEAAK